MIKILRLLAIIFISISFFPAASFAEETVLRIGHFPNLTHAHGLIAHNHTRTGKGWFESRAGQPVKIEWYTYNAGPSAMEALLVGAIDFVYVGPNPAINAFARTKGEEVRVLAGATSGGAALVVQADGGIEKPADFRGKKIATPQLGNTQDVAARSWLLNNGIKVTQTGGEAYILPTENPDQLALFMRHQIDAAWTVEPWVTRLEKEANGRIFLEEKDAITTILAGSAKMVSEQPALVKAILAAHVELSDWIAANPQEAQALVLAELEAETSRSVSPELVSQAWKRMHFSAELLPERFNSFIASAKQVGFLKDVQDLKRFFYEHR